MPAIGSDLNIRGPSSFRLSQLLCGSLANALKRATEALAGRPEWHIGSYGSKSTRWTQVLPNCWLGNIREHMASSMSLSEVHSWI